MVLRLIDLPPEVIHNVLIFVDPVDLGWIPRVCKALHYTVTDNSALFRDIYLAHLDAPPKGHNVDWVQTVRDLGRLHLICKRESVDSKKKELAFVHDTVVTILKNANGSKGNDTGEELPDNPGSSTAQEVVALTPYLGSRNARLLSSLLADPTNQAAFMCRSFIFERARAEIGSTSSALLRRAGLNSFAGRSPGLPGEHQQSARLHCLYGVPLLFANPVTAASAGHGRRGDVGTVADCHGSCSSRYGTEMSPYACSVVYDLRQYTAQTEWGPFMDDDTGRVDWEKMEALMIVLGHRIRRMGFYRVPICRSWWDVPFGGCWPGSYVDPLMPKSDSSGDRPPTTTPSSWPASSSTTTTTTKAANTSKQETYHQQSSALNDDDDEDEETKAQRQAQADLDARDPFGVTGTYIRIVCFLDYTDFFAYNFTHRPEPHVPRPAIDYGQATRLIHMTCRVTAIEDEERGDGSGSSSSSPVVRFVGKSKSLHSAWGDEDGGVVSNDAHSDLRGEVRLTPEGEVRWTTWSIFSGEERWRSEGIQVGGAKSARGIIGNWFDAEFDDHGPAGPTAFWKITNNLPSPSQPAALPWSVFGPFPTPAMVQEDHPLYYEDDGNSEDIYSDGDEDDDDDDDEEEQEQGLNDEHNVDSDEEEEQEQGVNDEYYVFRSDELIRLEVRESIMEGRSPEFISFRMATDTAVTGEEDVTNGSGGGHNDSEDE